MLIKECLLRDLETEGEGGTKLLLLVVWEFVDMIQNGNRCALANPLEDCDFVSLKRLNSCHIIMQFLSFVLPWFCRCFIYDRAIK